VRITERWNTVRIGVYDDSDAASVKSARNANDAAHYENWNNRTKSDRGADSQKSTDNQGGIRRYFLAGTPPVRWFHGDLNTATCARRMASLDVAYDLTKSGGTVADRALFKRIYRIFAWVTLVSLVVTILLVLRKSPPPQVANDPNAAARAQQKFEAADAAKASGQPAQVRLDGTELNSYLAQNLQMEGSAPSAPQNSSSPAGNSPRIPATPSDPAAGIGGSDQPTLEQVQSSVKDVKVDMDGDLVKAYVLFDFHGKDMSLELDGHLRTENGYIRFEPVSGMLGSLPLPQSTLQAAVARMMASPENREKLKLPADISDIQIVNGQAVVKYKDQ
jgi:hypothetical protein